MIIFCSLLTFTLIGHKAVKSLTPCGWMLPVHLMFLCFLPADLWEALDDDSDPTQSALTAVASLAAAWPQLHQGSGLKQLDLDSCTLSEILRLYILASGADCNHSNAKFRYQKQGGFTVMDDPCVELRLSVPALLKRLSCTPVYDLTPGQ